MNPKIITVCSCLVFGLFLLSWCQKEPEQNLEISNPASEYCVNNWWVLEIQTSPDWGQYWVCYFNDWSYCDEREFFNGNCNPWDLSQEAEESDFEDSENDVDDEYINTEEENTNNEVADHSEDGTL